MPEKTHIYYTDGGIADVDTKSRPFFAKKREKACIAGNYIVHGSKIRHVGNSTMQMELFFVYLFFWKENDKCERIKFLDFTHSEKYFEKR